MTTVMRSLVVEMAQKLSGYTILRALKLSTDGPHYQGTIDVQRDEAGMKVTLTSPLGASLTLSAADNGWINPREDEYQQIEFHLETDLQMTARLADDARLTSEILYLELIIAVSDVIEEGPPDEAHLLDPFLD